MNSQTYKALFNDGVVTVEDHVRAIDYMRGCEVEIERLRDAVEKGRLAREMAGGMEVEITELRARVAELEGSASLLSAQPSTIKGEECTRSMLDSDPSGLSPGNYVAPASPPLTAQPAKAPVTDLHRTLADAAIGALMGRGGFDGWWGDVDDETSESIIVELAETFAALYPDTRVPEGACRVERESLAASWRCFHCDEVFTTAESAQEHFGKSMVQNPACQIDIAEYRAMEQRMQRYNEEDSDLHREIYRLRSQHHLDRQREEEKGYARGLKDGAAQPVAQAGVPEGIQQIMHEVFKYADIAAPLRGAPMTQEESLPVRKAALAQDRVIRDMLYELAASPAPTKQADEHWKQAYEAEAAKFRTETLRTSELHSLLTRFVELIHPEHKPGAWSRGCIQCRLVGEAMELLQKPVNIAHPEFIRITDTTRARTDLADALRDMADDLRQSDDGAGIHADYAQSDVAIAIAKALESDTLWRQSLAVAPTPEGG